MKETKKIKKINFKITNNYTNKIIPDIYKLVKNKKQNELFIFCIYCYRILKFLSITVLFLLNDLGKKLLSSLLLISLKIYFSMKKYFRYTATLIPNLKFIK